MALVPQSRAHRRWLTFFSTLCLLLSSNLAAGAETSRVSGKVLDPQSAPVAGARVQLVNAAGTVIREIKSDGQGNFVLAGIDPGEYQITAQAPSFVTVIVNVSVAAGQQKSVNVQFQQLLSLAQSVTVVESSPSALTPDPGQTIVIHDQVLDANPGRPGAPISIPGLPIETASGGIKAPQYFAPGVAGDHGEPIAQYFQIADFLYPNNLPANAHGNGYADPNFLIPPTIEGVTVNGGAFNVRKATTPLISLRRISRDSGLQVSSNSRETIAMPI